MDTRYVSYRLGVHTSVAWRDQVIDFFFSLPDRVVKSVNKTKWSRDVSVTDQANTTL